jgi:hypothetical protein
MKHLALLGLLTLLNAAGATGAAERGVLEPRVHLVHGDPNGDPILVYYEVKRPLELKSVNVPGLPIRSWRFVTAFSKRSLEIEIIPKAGLNLEWNALRVVDSANRQRTLGVAPGRAMTIPRRQAYEINFERMEQQPSTRLYLGLRIFNDAAQPVTIEKFIYAPSAAATNRILVQPRYDKAWFTQLETWTKQNGSALPEGSSLMNSNALNLTILPSRGFSAAVVAQSFKPEFSCTRAGIERDPGKRVDSAYLQPIIQYRVGNGKPLFYPIPDAIIADLCP